MSTKDENKVITMIIGEVRLGIPLLGVRKGHKVNVGL